MPRYLPSLDNADLLDWRAAERRLGDDRILLLGNGGSRAVWDGFAYQSLYREATRTVEHPLDDDDRGLFKQLGGRDFELVLGALLNARRVCEVLGLETIHLRERYRSIQRALREAIGSAHIEWSLIPPSTLGALRTHYRTYKAVYTTNYDLLLYWAVMSAPPDSSEFVDFFWGEQVRFDPWDIDVRSTTATALLYLHGALHLRHLSTARTQKETAQYQNLLSSLSMPFSTDATPLIVTEGSSAEKERAIRSSDYLSFALDRLATDSRSMVVFGHALGEQDTHIARAVRKVGIRRIAVGIHRNRADVADRKRHYAGRLGGADLYFFDSSAHPLGLPELKVGP